MISKMTTNGFQRDSSNPIDLVISDLWISRRDMMCQGSHLFQASVFLFLPQFNFHRLSTSVFSIRDMNRVPVTFWECVCGTSRVYELLEAEKLSGNIGELARMSYGERAFYYTYVEGDTEGNQRIWYTATDRSDVTTFEEMEAVPKKSVLNVTINLENAGNENVSRDVVRRFPHAIYHFTLWSPSLNDDSVRLFQKLVIGQKLSWITIHGKACSGDMLELLKSALCQDQFEELNIKHLHDSPNGTVVRELLKFWAENSEKMKGKKLILEYPYKEGVPQSELSMLHRSSVSSQLSLPLKICSKKECENIDKYYRHRRRLFIKPSCIYKFEEGKGDERRRIYISFECAKQHEQVIKQEDRLTIIQPSRAASFLGQKDLSLMGETTELHMLFV
uniref:FBA_2 domain-containing protein n=1 Tax=Steinernema glaseri TaxID=37863 RepID=A0A1I7ZYN3_9BILA